MRTDAQSLVQSLTPSKCSIVLTFPLPMSLVSREAFCSQIPRMPGLNAHLNAMVDRGRQTAGLSPFLPPSPLSLCWGPFERGKLLINI